MLLANREELRETRVLNQRCQGIFIPKKLSTRCSGCIPAAGHTAAVRIPAAARHTPPAAAEGTLGPGGTHLVAANRLAERPFVAVLAPVPPLPRSSSRPGSHGTPANL